MFAQLRTFALGLVVTLLAASNAAADTGMPSSPTVQQADAAWAHRDEEASLRKSLQLYEQAVKGATKEQQRVLYERLAEGTFLLAKDYEPEDSKQQQALYQRSALLGEACLRLEPAYAKKVKNSFDEAVASVQKPFAGCLFFKAAGSSRDAQITGIMKSLSRKPAIDAMMKRVYKVNPTYLYGAPDRYYGVYYMVLPGILGGSKSKAKEHFAKALDIAPNFLGTKILMAENLYDKGSPEYKKILTEVVQADPNKAPPGYAPENRIEQRKARKMLGMATAS